MKIFKHTQLGTHHENHTEDFAIYKDIGASRLLLAVMDGCTMGQESHFASALIGKLLRKIAHEEFYKEYATQSKIPLTNLLDAVIIQLLELLKQLQADLHLDKYELLSTLVLSLVDLEEQVAESIVIGDGLIVVNGKFHDFDQENAPDYIGYHLTEDPKVYLGGLTQRLSSKSVTDLSVSTDGVYTFSRFDTKDYPEISDSDILHEFFVNKEGLDHERFFTKTSSRLAEDHGLKPTDDLGMIRLCLDGAIG